jgi:uncharacterized protein (DUF608 family)
LGGIGSGGVEIWPDGRLYRWNMVNARPWAKAEKEANADKVKGSHSMDPIEPAVMDTDWFVRIAERGKRPVYRWLFTGHGYAVGTASHFWRVHKYFFLKSFPRIDYRAEFPFVHLTYVDPVLPVRLTLRAWTSFIPRDVKNSSLPCCYFDFTLENRTAKRLDVSLVWQQQNLAGYAAPTVVQEHEELVKGRLHMVDMRGSTAEPQHDSSGDMCMWALKNPGQRVTMVAANPYMQNLIWPIYRTGALDGPIMPPHIKHEELNATPSPRAPNKGWLCVQQKLPPRAKREMNLGLAWFFPNHRSIRGTRVGHVYENWFANATEAARYQAANREKLLERSQLMPSLLMRSSLPQSLKLSLLDQLSTLTKSTHFIKNGRIGLQEGHGCCAFNTVDVDHYSSYAFATLFPQIRRKILQMQTTLAHPDNGKIHHGLPGTVEDVSAGGDAHGGYSRWDVCCQYTLQVYRDTKWAGDLDTMKECYPTAKRAMELVATLDFYGVGLPFIQGGITYDHWNMQGVVAYMGGVYIAALKALEKMATVVGDDDGAAWARMMAERGIRGFEKFLWNGRQYLLYYGRRPKGWKPGDDAIGEHKLFDAVKPPPECMPDHDPAECGPDCPCHERKSCVELRDTGLMTDLLNGNGTAAVMGLGAFLEPARVKRQLQLTLKRNVQEENFSLINGSYPDGHYLDQWPFMQWQTPWTGSEYFFALMCYAAGMVKEGDRVVELVYERHAREGMRFDHAEANNHYARPLCIWGAYAARVGLDVDGYRHGLAIRPADGGAYDGALMTAQATGRLVYRTTKGATRVAVEIMAGALPLRTLTLRTKGVAATARVSVDGKAVAGDVVAEKGESVLRFRRLLKLKPGNTLSVVLK